MKTLAEPTNRLVADPQDEEQAHDLIWQLIQADKGLEARQRAIDWSSRFPDSLRLKRWANVLNPSFIVSSPATGNDSSRSDDEWIREHAREYPGQWIAVSDGEFVAASPSLGEVRSKAAEAGIPAKKVVLWRQGPESLP